MVLVKTSFPAFSLVDEKRVTFTAGSKSFFLFQKFCSLSGIRNTESTGLFKYKGRIHSFKSVVLRPSPLLKFQLKVLANENSPDFTYFLKDP